ncbi:MAG: 6-phosphofructokinase [Limnochordia bacterium]|jgi:6-phosphofructokinase 1
MPKPARIGVLTSGGDAPGMNAAIRAVVRSALSEGIRVFGIERGFQGLIQGALVELTSRSVADIIHRGGTILRSARSEEFKTPEGLAKALGVLKRLSIDGLIVLGGDGSFRGARDLVHAGVPVVAIPATIDNDIPCTDQAIGFDTAVNTVVGAINKIRDTATSHERIIVVEVMGREAGYIALNAGLAGGAESILIPEVPADLDGVCARISFAFRVGKAHSIVVVAEGVGTEAWAAKGGPKSAAMYVGNYIMEKTGLETRITILGHLQRGGTPTALDQIVASRLGHAAVGLLAADRGGRVVSMVKGDIRTFDIDEALAMRKSIDPVLYSLAHVLSSI